MGFRSPLLTNTRKYNLFLHTSIDRNHYNPSIYLQIETVVTTFRASINYLSKYEFHTTSEKVQDWNPQTQKARGTVQLSHIAQVQQRRISNQGHYHIVPENPQRPIRFNVPRIHHHSMQAVRIVVMHALYNTSRTEWDNRMG